MSQDFASKNNREGSEPKKKLKKTRSVRLSKAPSLKASSRRFKSRFSWLLADLSGDDTTTATGLSDPWSNYIEPGSCCDAKKDNDQGGNENDDATSVGSSSYASFVNQPPALNQATRIKKMLKNYGSSRSFGRRAKSKSVQSPTVASSDSATPQHLSSADGSPNYLKATSSSGGRNIHPQASPWHSESSFNSSDQSNGQGSAPTSVSASQKSLARTSSMRSVKIVINKASPKAKRSSLKSLQISEDSNVDKATCSSTLKDSKFPKHVELHTGQTEAERISKTKVCPYHHCSLNGRSHDPPPKHPLYKKRQPLKSQKSTKSVSESSPGVKISGGRKKEIHISQMNSKEEYTTEEDGIAITILTPREDDQDMGFSIKIHAKSRAQFSIKAGGEVVEIFASESSYHEESQQESVDQMISSSLQIQNKMETSELKGTSEACRCDNTEEHKLTLVSSEVGSDEVTASNVSDREQDSTKNGNGDLSHIYAPALNMKPNDQVMTSSEYDSNFNGGPGEGEPSTLIKNSDNVVKVTESGVVSATALDGNVLGEFKTTEGQKNSNLDSETISVTGLEQVQDSEKHSMLTRDSESSAPSEEGFGTQINKQKHISMWHLIQQHMASGVAAESEMKPIHRENKEKLVEDITPLPAATITETTESSYDSGMSAENQDRIDQDIEIRKVFAIKLVREAIEKILLPEVPDQSSDIQSITSETMSDHDHSESNFSEESAEDKQKESDQRKGDDKTAADRKELGHANNIFGLEKEKTGTKHEKKSDRRAPKHWSNLKKWILLQRFIKALEKVKQFNPKKPQHLQLEPDPGAEKVSLRPQTVEERKRAEEWMLDYAVRQAVSQLAPTQKKKVSLLVKAFETVKPPQGDSGVHLAFPKLKETSDGGSPHTAKKIDEPFSQGKSKTKETKEIDPSIPDFQERNSIANNEATNPSAPVVADSRLVNNVSLKPNDITNSTSDKLPADEKQKQDSWEEALSNLNANGSEQSITKIEGHKDLNGDLAVSTEITSSILEDIPLTNPIPSKLEMNEESKAEHLNLLEIHENTSSSSNSEFVSGSSGSGINNILVDEVYGKANELSTEFNLVTQAGDVKSIATRSAICSTSPSDTFLQQAAAKKERQREFRREDAVLREFDVDSKPNEDENEQDKRNYIRMWHMVYQHVVSSIAEKVGSKLLEGTDDEEAEDDNKTPDFSNKIENAGDDKSETLWKGRFSKSDAIKLVHEAVNEILLPEIEDESSETQSVTSDTVQDQEISEKIHTEGGEQNILNSSELIKNHLREEGSKEDKKAEPLVRNKSKLPKSKNWSKLKKLILLKRSITALEKARKLKPQPQKDLPLMADPEPEKVDLRHQMSDERNKAEQWMLDYAVQNIVNTLTPARKRRVAMLVEAFEAVVPLPEM